MVADILLEVNVAKEESKYGFFLEDKKPVLPEDIRWQNRSSPAQ